MSSYELERTRRELGIPDGEQVASFTRDAEDFNPEWAGFRLEFFGVVASKPSYVGEYPYAESADGVGVRVWRLRIRKDGAQAYIEALSRGMLGYQSIDLRNLDPLNRTENQKVLQRGMVMLYPIPMPSRRQGRTRTLDDLQDAYQGYYAAKQEYPNKGQLAAELGVDAKTVERIIGGPWEPFAARARRKIHSRTVRFMKR